MDWTGALLSTPAAGVLHRGHKWRAPVPPWRTRGHRRPRSGSDPRPRGIWPAAESRPTTSPCTSSPAQAIISHISKKTGTKCVENYWRVFNFPFLSPLFFSPPFLLSFYPFSLPLPLPSLLPHLPLLSSSVFLLSLRNTSPKIQLGSLGECCKLSRAGFGAIRLNEIELGAIWL